MPPPSLRKDYRGLQHYPAEKAHPTLSLISNFIHIECGWFEIIAQPAAFYTNYTYTFNISAYN